MNHTILKCYLHYCHFNKRLSPHSLRAYETDLNQFLSTKNISLAKYIDSLSKNYKKTSTLKRKIASLKSFYHYMEEEKIISENPFHTLRFRFRAEQTLPKTIPLHDLKSIYNYFQNKYKNKKSNFQMEKTLRNLLIVELLISTGLRISELCNLKLSNLHLQNRTLTIIGKGKKERIIYIGNEHTISLISTYIDNFHKNQSIYLFFGQNKKEALQEQSVRFMLKIASQKLKLNRTITPHMFRHTFATMLLDNNVDIRQIQHILGHSSITVTQIYTHVSQTKQQEILTSHNPINSVL
ncbi:tyrosine-type recombinase/integrase [Streptococcus constellatus]|uniref:tyrosine-type recombinase/integrase n=1 Tax=Streptococcus constellatus TaxID=76860 RepID=UPI002101F6A5|nr:tyrosine-type recombinase/integrase [Streptococcus constellatus]UTX63852.1 integrase [Streptococcus constellatus]